MEISVIEHEVKEVGLLFHYAIVEVDEYNGNEEKLVEEVSTKVGYHPLGHGIYKIHFVKQYDENTYGLKWETGTHCH